MKKWLQEILVCPECLPEEISLDLEILEEHDDDVTAGNLICPVCNKHYPINNGVAVILPEASMGLVTETAGYNSMGMLSSYLWSHYSDYFHDPNATDAYKAWSSYFRNMDGYALDIGCAVGRLSFDLSKTHSHVIGIDTSLSFIKKARHLMQKKQLVFDMIVEGHITEKRSCELDPAWHYDRVDFIVADALALPFPKRIFSTVTSVNILEKVSGPAEHLIEINRVLGDENTMFMFSDPFSWDETVSNSRQWLGGISDGSYAGRGIDNMCDIFSGRDDIFDPPLEIIDKGNLSWKIRKTENLWEYITSQFLVGCR